MANSLDITLHALAQETASGSSTAVDIGTVRSAVRLTLQVTVLASGDFNVFVETSLDNATGWRQVGSFEQVTSVPKLQLLHMDDCDRYVRVRWEQTGNVTFQLVGTAHTLYALQEDVYGEVPGDYIERATNDTITKRLIEASSIAEAALNQAGTVPKTVWPMSLRQNVAAIAAWKILTRVGVNPTGKDEVFRDNHDDSMKWLAKVAKREFKPPGLTPDAELDAQYSSGDPLDPTKALPRFSDDWGDFG